MNHHQPSKNKPNKVFSSFRDPSGFLFEHDGILYRHINDEYKKHYQAFISTGLYQELVGANSIVSHDEVELPNYKPVRVPWKVIRPQFIPFISYPYEWSFGMLKTAALATLDIQKKALQQGMILKDASAFNIQFLDSQPILIDTLSFEIYEEGKPWVAYRQFVEHFLAPLYLMTKVAPDIGQLKWAFLDGIPVDVASRLLDWRSLFNMGTMLHIHAHAASQKKFGTAGYKPSSSAKPFSRTAFGGLIASLERAVRNITWDPGTTQWSHYYVEDQNNYTAQALEHKDRLVGQFLKKIHPKVVWDIGANTGRFSQLAADAGAHVIAFDNDWGALEKHYQTIVRKGEKRILPLYCDLANPTPALGWMNQERASLEQRGPADVLLALALVHHLAISRNLPLSYIAQCFASLGTSLVIEFVDKSDSQVQKLLANRQNIFKEYTREHFEKVFTDFFNIEQIEPIEGSKRTLYLMRKRNV